MNKKLARRLGNHRRKQMDQELRRRERYANYRKRLGKFAVTDETEARYDYLAKTRPPSNCLVCGKKILQKDLKSKRFVAMTSSLSARSYLIHFEHIYDGDRGWKKDGAGAAVEAAYVKIFAVEFAEFKEFLSGGSNQK